MKYGYARVSTSDQKLENQISILEEAGAEKIYQEKFSGVIFTCEIGKFTNLFGAYFGRSQSR